MRRAHMRSELSLWVLALAMFATLAILAPTALAATKVVVGCASRWWSWNGVRVRAFVASVALALREVVAWLILWSTGASALPVGIQGIPQG